MNIISPLFITVGALIAIFPLWMWWDLRMTPPVRKSAEDDRLDRVKERYVKGEIDLEELERKIMYELESSEWSTGVKGLGRKKNKAAGEILYFPPPKRKCQVCYYASPTESGVCVNCDRHWSKRYQDDMTKAMFAAEVARRA